MPALGRVLDRVVDEIDEDLPELIAVGVGGGRVLGDLRGDVDVSLSSALGHDLQRVVDRGADGDRPALPWRAAGREVGKDEHVVDPPPAAPGLPLDEGEEPQRRRAILPAAPSSVSA